MNIYLHRYGVMVLLPGCLFVKEDRRTDEDAGKGDQSPGRTDVGDPADCTGENGDHLHGKAATFQLFSQHGFFNFFSDPGEILLNANANQADSDSDYLL